MSLTIVYCDCRHLDVDPCCCYCCWCCFCCRDCCSASPVGVCLRYCNRDSASAGWDCCCWTVARVAAQLGRCTAVTVAPLRDGRAPLRRCRCASTRSRMVVGPRQHPIITYVFMYAFSSLTIHLRLAADVAGSPCFERVSGAVVASCTCQKTVRFCVLVFGPDPESCHRFVLACPML